MLHLLWVLASLCGSGGNWGVGDRAFGIPLFGGGVATDGENQRARGENNGEATHENGAPPEIERTPVSATSIVTLILAIVGTCVAVYALTSALLNKDTSEEQNEKVPFIQQGSKKKEERPDNKA